jgi:hypothetical protein
VPPGAKVALDVAAWRYWKVDTAILLVTATEAGMPLNGIS